jgi:hypothetical protein
MKGDDEQPRQDTRDIDDDNRREDGEAIGSA